MTDEYEPYIRGPLKHALRNPRSLIRAFLDEHLAAGLKEVQADFRRSTGSDLAIPPGTANAGTIGTAADWLLRFLIHPAPGLAIPLRGAEILDHAPGMEIMPASLGLAETLGILEPTSGTEAPVFARLTTGSTADPDLLMRGCWVLALLTEVFRAGQKVGLLGPLGQLFKDATPSVDHKLLDLASANALEQLTAFGAMFEDVLLPQLAAREGTWVIGPAFAGSRLVGGADADLIADGLLLDLKASSKKLALPQEDVFQVVSYALLDFDDAFGLDSVGVFAARYGHLATWPLTELVSRLHGAPLGVAELRAAFRDFLNAHQRPDALAAHVRLQEA